MILKVKKMKLSKLAIPSIVIQLFYFFYFIRMIIGPTTIYGTFIYILMTTIGIISLLYIILTKKLIYKSKIVIFIISFFLFGIISSMYTGNYRLQDYLILLQYFGIAILLWKYKLNYFVMKIFFYFYAIFFAINMIMGVSPDVVFIGFSRNNISVILLVQVTLLYISEYENNLKTRLYPVIIVFLFSLWTTGRSGIFVSLLLLLLLLIYVQYKNRKKSLKVMYLFIVLFILYLVLSAFFYDDLIKPALNRLIGLGFSDSHRGSIIIEYFYNIKVSISSLIFGVPIKQNSLFAVYGYNLHNSYLRLHAYHGLFGFILVFFYILKTIYRFMLKKEFLYLSLFLVLLIRASTDILAFHGPFDTIIYYFVFLEIGKNSDFKKIKEV